MFGPVERGRATAYALYNPSLVDLQPPYRTTRRGSESAGPNMDLFAHLESW